MSETIEKEIQSLLGGLPFDTDVPEAAGTKPGDTSNLPIIQKTVSYVVAAVVVNDNGEVLMIQEAHASCHGKWYLPAGRVIPNETLIEAVKREVLEETCLEFEPRTLILVETAGDSWFRFVFTGEITGGSIKTVRDADEHSLQASWVRNVEELPLRSKDLLALVDRARNFLNSSAQHPRLMPIPRPLARLYLRVTITSKKKATNRLHVLVSDAAPFHLPVCEINESCSLFSTLHKFMERIFGNGVAQHWPHGLLFVEFSGGNGGDGLCLTILVSFKLPLEEIKPIGKYTWHELTENTAARITARLPRNMTVPLNVVR